MENDRSSSTADEPSQKDFSEFKNLQIFHIFDSIHTSVNKSSVDLNAIRFLMLWISQFWLEDQVLCGITESEYKYKFVLL